MNSLSSVIQTKHMRTTLAIIIAGALALSTLSCKQPATEEKKEPVQAAKVTDEWTLGVQLWTFHKFDFVTAVKKADSSGLKIMEAFPGQKLGRPMSDTTLAKVMERHAPGCTVHGFRSTFRDWVSDRTDFPRDLAESALAHVVGDATERAYRRGDAIEKRRVMMSAWAAFACSAPRNC
jgi:hypothetical protein